MHILESYSLNCGAKIDKPHIYKNFFPMPFEKFIVFAPNIKSPAREYSYFQDVINMIFPILEKEGIKILQISPKNSLKFERAIDISGKTSYSQAAYLISNSMLVFGNDGFESYVAGVEDIPLVLINSISYNQNAGSYFGDKNKQKFFESFKNIGNNKASFNAQENPKSINSIKPEEIANAILEKLKIDFKIPFETVFLGEKYGYHTIQESIPNCKNINFHPESLIEIRADEEMTEEDLEFQLANYKKSVLISDKEINLNLIQKFKNNIHMLVFKVTKNNNLNFLQKAKSLGLNIHLVSEMSQEDINQEKIKYYEFGNINNIKKNNEELVSKLKKDLDKLYYKSCKIVSSNNKVYYSLAAKNKNINIQSTTEYQKVIDAPEFWENIDFFTIVKVMT